MKCKFDLPKNITSFGLSGTICARGIEDMANRQGFRVILCNTNEKKSKQADYLAVLLRKGVTGSGRAVAQRVHCLW